MDACIDKGQAEEMSNLTSMCTDANYKRIRAEKFLKLLDARKIILLNRMLSIFPVATVTCVDVKWDFSFASFRNVELTSLHAERDV
jgi:hypothetical protein